MGLSASSLRLAMLTARKSSLEFEGQQINQQRLTLSNQTAELFNSMLTMQVPTPPDPSEFSKMVYTFNKGNGVSTLLNVSRNPSGPYTHDVTYKGPKTDNVLMKKQLNNVGFKHENDQMSAVIDGLNYPLTLNGDEEKLNDYLETKKTYDNIKNIETQKRALESMPQDKELSSSQMRQYFEALGLSSYDTPSQGKVEDVETLDDAFKNVYNSGSGNYSYRDVTLTYKAATSPFELDKSKSSKLIADNGYLTMVEGNNKSYKYTNNNLTYNITENDDGSWSWNLTTPLNQYKLNSQFHISYKKQIYQVDESGVFGSVNSITDTDNENIIYTNFEYVKDNDKWNYKKQTSGEWLFIKNKYIDIQNVDNVMIDEIKYTIQKDGGKTYFLTDKKTYDNRNIVETPVLLRDGYLLYDVDNDGEYDEITEKFLKDASNPNKYTMSKTETATDKTGNSINNTIAYEINVDNDNHYTLNITRDKALGFCIDAPDEIKIKNETESEQRTLNDINGYWYNIKENYAASVLNEDTGDYEIDTNKENKDYETDNNWVWVYKNSDGKWQYTIDLGEHSANPKDYTQMVNENYEKKFYGNDNKETHTEIYKNNGNGNWTVQQKYTAAQLGGEITKQKIESCSGELPFEQFQDGNSYQIGITYTYTDKDSSKTLDSTPVEEDSEVSIGSYVIQQSQYKDNKNNILFKLSGNGLGSILGIRLRGDSDADKLVSYTNNVNGVYYCVKDEGVIEQSGRYSITAKFKAWVTGEDQDTWNNDEEQDGYSYDETNHTLTLTTPNGAIAQILLRNQNNQREEDDTNLTVNQMLGFFEEVLKQFGLYGSSINYKTKLDRAKAAYIDTLDAKGVENPDDNQALYSFIDANGNKAYIYVPLEYVKDDGHVESTYAYMCETSYLENQTETISQKANIIYDENGRIVKISFDDGTVVLPEVKTEQDEDAYNAAMVKYDYEKQVYDKELSDINTKTEIIAQQDKNLEIKLKSIDSQHSAISTEIEALKKVLDSSVKSSFGTFSA